MSRALLCTALCVAVAALAAVTEPSLESGRAFLGSAVANGAYPCIVEVLEKGKHANVGVIINPDYVLTEAYHYENYTVANIDPSQVTVKSGSVDVATAGTVHVATRVVPHPGYKFPKNDIALVKVTPPFTEAPCQLPKAGQTWPGFTKAKIFAWGGITPQALTQLKMAEVTILPDGTCANKQLEGWCSRSQICVQSVDPKSGLCDGDYGAPLLLDKVVAGINIYNSFDCSADPNQLDRFIDIMPYLGWIADNMI